MKDTLRVAIVGAGPAGFYAVRQLLAASDISPKIDVFERLPTPWGLVRYGVAPDHWQKKHVADRLFSVLIEQPNVRFFGNVEIGSDIQLTELRNWYHAVVISIGVDSDRRMGVPGEDLPGSWSAREFACWYNGHPDYGELKFDLFATRAAIIGQGHVALDVARMLAAPLSDLETTDVASHALERLRNSRIKEIEIVGRRGCAGSAFGIAGLEELGQLRNVGVSYHPGDNALLARDVSTTDWESQLKLETLKRLARRVGNEVEKSIRFRFFSSPLELRGDGRVEELLLTSTNVNASENGGHAPRQTREESPLRTGLVLWAIGCRGTGLPGLPFDEKLGVVENSEGRVVSGGKSLRGVYVCGWIKRGPTGLIGTNKHCAGQTIRHLLADFGNGKLCRPQTATSEIPELVQRRKPEHVNFHGWQRIDRAERESGRLQGRRRSKICDVLRMLEVAGTTTGA